MQGNNNIKHENILKFLRIGSLIVIAVMITLCAVYFRDSSVKDIVTYTPDNKLLSILVMLIFFALKSLSIVFYIKILYASCGVMYPLWLALIVNTLGIMIAVSIPFFIGRILGKDYADKLVEKYPKAKKIENITTKNGFLFSFLIKVIGFFPGDVSSMFMGAIGIRYRDYIFGATLGMIPAMIAVTVIGDKITDYKSPEFIIAVTVTVAISVFSAILFKIISNKQSEKGK